MGNSLAPQIENAKKTGVCSLNGKGLKEVSFFLYIYSCLIEKGMLGLEAITYLPDGEVCDISLNPKCFPCT